MMIEEVLVWYATQAGGSLCPLAPHSSSKQQRSQYHYQSEVLIWYATQAG